ncbi:MAG: prolyl oligopeptidase family serine peptidase [Clostridia bacterium]|nr:prolyl oligopeptidase family serine peptidase [Clostridia bacterium]
MQTVKRLVAVILTLMFVMSLPVSVSALSLQDGLDSLKAQFIAGEGPVVDDYSVDYRYFSPVKENDSTKYPLVVWLHGMGDGSEEGKQVEKSEIAYWASDEFQARFTSAGGAFILAARSREENGKFWDNDLIEPLRAAIDEFIAENKANVDTTRIYIGGYSMGGKMTLKMAVAYPEMFAAAFPICPAWSVPEEYAQCLSDMPIWITSSRRDPLVNYYLAVTPTWNRIIANSNVAEDCRFSTLTKVCYADGSKTGSSHHAWFSVNYDMFTIENGDYHYMTTVNGLGEDVKLTYPNGMISWLSQFTSDYDGTPCEGKGNLEGGNGTDSIIHFESICDFFEILSNAILSLLRIA